jgi:hypothetical protein
MARRPNAAEATTAPPDHRHAVLTVEEAAAALRIGRRLAYEQAARYLATGGAEGLPVVRLGRCLRVPRAKLEALLAVEPTLPELSPVNHLRGIEGGRRQRR